MIQGRRKEVNSRRRESITMKLERRSISHYTAVICVSGSYEIINNTT